MTATGRPTEPATAATPTTLLIWDVVRARCAELGYETDVAIAEFLDVDRVTLYRWRKKQIGVSLDTALRLSSVLDLPVATIVERAGSAA